jgi:NNP family nitrate/nitrite transporter-like MFS transporter
MAGPIRRTNRRAVLAIAVVGYALASWAWALMAPLAPLPDDPLGLTSMQQAMAVSLPVVGTLGRVAGRASRGYHAAQRYLAARG